MPFDIRKYPVDWKTRIVPAIRERAENKCEWCGVANGAVGARDKNNDWHDENEIENMNSGLGMELFGEYPKIIRIVLTTAHIHDPDPMNCDFSNLAYLCQKCHNGHDAKSRAANRKAKVARESGQLELITT